ncbi:Capsule polysaccharide export inner-membrane protein CtrB [Bienertia sinuspersici]
MICNCGIPVAHKQSWTSRNPGRRFVTCKLSNPAVGMNGCGTFAWVDDHQVEWQRVVINNLILEKKLLEEQNEQLKNKVCTLEDLKTKVERDLFKLKKKYEPVKSTTSKDDNKMLVGVIVLLIVVCVLFLAK